DLAGYVRDYDPEDPEDADGGGLGEEPDDEDEPDGFYLSEDEEFDDLTMEGLFLPVASPWQLLGATDDDERLTALGWCGLPGAGPGSARVTRTRPGTPRAAGPPRPGCPGTAAPGRPPEPRGPDRPGPG